MYRPRFTLVLLAFFFWFHLTSEATWVVNRPHDGRQTKPPSTYAEGKEIKPGDVWPNDDKFRWMRGELEIPATIDGKQAEGECVGLRLNCGDGGEVFVDGRIVSRFDNDHPALLILTREAKAGMKMLGGRAGLREGSGWRPFW